VLTALSWLVYGDLNDQPACVSEVIAEVVRNVNDLLPDERRQNLKGYISRLIDTTDSDAIERKRLSYVHRHIIEELVPQGLIAAGLDYLVPVLRKLGPTSLVRLKPFIDEIVCQALRDPSWPDAAMALLQIRIERGLWNPNGLTAPETIDSALDSIALAIELRPQMASEFYDGLFGLLDGVLLIGRGGIRRIDDAVIEERAFVQTA
jgi:hypothetical protein